MSDFIKNLETKVNESLTNNDSINQPFSKYIELKARDKNKERIELIGKAIEVAISLEGQLKKIKPDIQPTRGLDGTLTGSPGYSSKQWSLKEASETRYNTILKLLTDIETFTVKPKDDINTKANELDQMYQQLKINVDKASKDGSNK